MKLTKTFIIGFVTFFCWSGSLFADYTIVLKSGGRVTVQRYWQETGMVKFYGLGGVIGIARQQIQSILRAREDDQQGMVIATIKNSQRTPVAERKVPTPGITVTEAKELGTLKAKEEQEAQKMYAGLKKQIKSRTDRHWRITRGTSNPDPTLLNSLEALNGRINDLKSRIKDAQHNPKRAAGTGVVNLITNSPFTGRKATIQLRHGRVIRPGRVNTQLVRGRRVGVRLPGYTRSEWELSESRNQLNLLYEERKRLVEKMRQKEMFTGSVPFEAFP